MRANILSTNIVRVMQATRDLEAIGRGELRYRFDGRDTALKSVRDTVTQVRQLTTDAARDALHEDRRRAFHAVHDALAAHLKSFEQFVTLTGSAGEKQTKLFASGEDLTYASGELFSRTRMNLDAATSAAADKKVTLAEERTALAATATSAAAEAEREILAASRPRSPRRSRSRVPRPRRLPATSSKQPAIPRK